MLIFRGVINNHLNYCVHNLPFQFIKYFGSDLTFLIGPGILSQGSKCQAWGNLFKKSLRDRNIIFLFAWVLALALASKMKDLIWNSRPDLKRRWALAYPSGFSEISAFQNLSPKLDLMHCFCFGIALLWSNPLRIYCPFGEYSWFYVRICHFFLWPCQTEHVILLFDKTYIILWINHLYMNQNIGWKV